MVIEAASRNDLVEALLALLNGPTGLGGLEPVDGVQPAAYEVDEAPTEGGNYVTVWLRRVGGVGNRRATGQIGPSAWELTARAVGDVTNVGALLHRCSRAIEDHSITVGGESSTGIQFLGDSDMAQDDDDQALYFGDRDWSFAF